MKFVLAAVLVLMLSSVALAAPETHQLGPFKVSFDMNTNLNYQIQMPEPMGDSVATSYMLALKTDNVTGATIAITEYSNPIDSTPQVHKSLTRMGLALYNGINITTIDDKMIDGKDGFLETGVPFASMNAPADTTFYQATYWLDSKDCECGAVSVGQTRVVITSTYLDDVTMNLLNSIKVEKTGETTAKAATSDMPPSQ